MTGFHEGGSDSLEKAISMEYDKQIADLKRRLEGASESDSRQIQGKVKELTEAKKKRLKEINNLLF